eukprot:scaffold24096_cov64-Phaeocystis_antarctica.AAC.14
MDARGAINASRRAARIGVCVCAVWRALVARACTVDLTETKLWPVPVDVGVEVILRHERLDLVGSRFLLAQGRPQLADALRARQSKYTRIRIQTPILAERAATLKLCP